MITQAPRGEIHSVVPRYASQEVHVPGVEVIGFAAGALAHIRQSFLPLSEALPHITREIEGEITHVACMPHLLNYARARIGQGQEGSLLSVEITDDRLECGYELAESTLDIMKKKQPVFARMVGIARSIVRGSFDPDTTINVDPLTDKPLLVGVQPEFLLKAQAEAVYNNQLPMIHAVTRGNDPQSTADHIATELVGFMRYLSTTAPEVKTKAIVAKAEHGTRNNDNDTGVLTFTDEGFVFAGLPCDIDSKHTLYTQYASPILGDNWAVPKLPKVVFQNRSGEPCLLTGTTIALLMSETYPGMYATEDQGGVRPANIEDLAYLAEHVAMVRQGVTVSL